MELSPAEIRTLQRIRSGQRRWRFYRWWCLFAGVFSTVGGFLLVQSAGEKIVEGGPFGMAAIVPLYAFWTQGLVGVLVLTWTLMRWSGDIRGSLLLKLVDELSKKQP